MRTDVPLTPQQAQQRYADLLSAIGAPERADRRHRRRRRESRRTAQRYAWWRRLRLA